MKVAHVASEVAPWSKTGGLADVVGALPAALSRLGCDVAVFTPLYRGVRSDATDTGLSVDVELGETRIAARLFEARAGDGPPVYLVDAPVLYDRDGVYGDAGGRDYPDNALRFAALSRAAVEAAPRVLGAPPDVVHAHDWQAGLAPLFARGRSVFTIHNLDYRGLFPKDVLPELGLDWSLHTPDTAEFHDQTSFLKAGVALADAVTTVSPSYASEITTPEYGDGLDEFLRAHADRLRGIVNGIDTGAWNPATDPALPAGYSTADPSNKRACRAALVDELGIEPAEGALLIAIVSRFAHHKGLDLVADLAPELADLGAHVAILGVGDPALERRFRNLSADPGVALTARIAFDDGLARRMYAGCDALLMPSLSEPCGLNQLYAMRYGAVPIVHAVGGLRDTVTDGETGFSFEHADVGGVRWAVGRAARVFREDPDAWRAIRAAGMARDSSWSVSAAQYLALYRELQSTA